jgi:hypothetical protein
MKSLSTLTLAAAAIAVGAAMTFSAPALADGTPPKGPTHSTTTKGAQLDIQNVPIIDKGMEEAGHKADIAM